jgi:hypothetical protein
LLGDVDRYLVEVLVTVVVSLLVAVVVVVGPRTVSIVARVIVTLTVVGSVLVIV